MKADLDKAMTKYFEAKKEYDRYEAPGFDRLADVQLARGVVRGLAKAVGRMESPYYPIRGMKNAERESVRRVRGNESSG